MAYFQDLAGRVDTVLERINPPQLIDKKMFGGISFMVQGNIACGVIDNFLIVRVGKKAYQDAMAQLGSRVFDITGRPMTGWVMVSDDVLGGEGDLLAWVQQGVDFALSLPPK